MILALGQMRPEINNKKANIEKMLAMAKEASDDGADFIAFPELCLTGYLSHKKHIEHAEEVAGSLTIDKLKKMAKDENISIVFGMPERSGTLVFNSAILVEPSGEVKVYRKTYLVTFEYDGVEYQEHMYFRPGNSNLEPFTTRFGKIGVEICYDFWFPEIVKAYCLQGAWLVINISAAPFEVPNIVHTVCRARAVEHQTFFAYVNQVGSEEAIDFMGRSFIVNHDSEIIKEASFSSEMKEEIIKAELNPAEIIRTRLDLPVLRDVRPEVLYKVANIAENLYYPGGKAD